MSSIKEAIVRATHDTLKSYLAPELVEQRTEEIISRAAPEMEEALRAFAGFELGRPGTVRAKTAAAPAQRKMNKVARKPKQNEAEVEPAFLTADPGLGRHDGGGEAALHLS
jgi:hypothetical protein